MEFRTLIWGTLARCCSSEACAKLAVECGLVPSLGAVRWVFQSLCRSLLESLDAEPPAEQQKWSQDRDYS